VCNLHSMTTNVEAIRRLFQVDASNDKSGNLPAMLGIYLPQRVERFIAKKSTGHLGGNPSRNRARKTGREMDSQIDLPACRTTLEQLFLVSSRSEKSRTGRGSDDPFFGVRLHQFISGAGRAYPQRGR